MRARGPALTVAGAAAFSLWLSFVQWTGLRLGLLDRGMLELIQHETPPFGAWTGRVHPPLYSVFLWGMELGGPALGVTPEELVFLHGAAVHLLLVLLVAGLAWRLVSPGAAAVAAVAAAFGTEALRSFEHYPISALATTAAGGALLLLSERGGRAAAGATAVLGFVALMLHLSPWFLFGPLVLALLWTRPDARRRVALAGVLVFVAFASTTWPGLFRQLAEGGEVGGEPGVFTFGWLNGFLYLPLALFALPSVRAALPPGARPLPALALGLAAYALITFALQILQLADGQPYPSSLHYFGLVEPLVLLGASAAFVVAQETLRGRARWALGALAALVVGTQAWRWVDGMNLLWREQHTTWIAALSPWSWL